MFLTCGIWMIFPRAMAFFEIFKPIIWAQLCAYGNYPCSTKSLLFFFGSAAKLFSGNSKPYKLTQNGPKRCIFRNFQTHYLGSIMCLWQLPMYQKCTDFFLDPKHKRFFSGISRGSWPKMAQKGAFFEIFKPIIWAQLCAYGTCPCTKSLLNFFQI